MGENMRDGFSDSFSFVGEVCNICCGNQYISMRKQQVRNQFGIFPAQRHFSTFRTPT
jgi:hypothetical protein